MSDRLEEFVRHNREQFDLHEPDPAIWLRINPAPVPMEEAKKGRRPMRFLRIAASIALIFAGFSAGIYFLTGNQSASKEYSALYMEMQETEQYYAGMVAKRYEELRPYFATDPGMEEMVSTDLAELDQVYEELKEDLKDNVSNPEVVEAMILNYRVKLGILEDLLAQIKEKENQDEKDENVSL